MLDPEVIRQQLDAAHGAFKAGMTILETLYGALKVAEQQTESQELSVDDVPTLEAIPVDEGCPHLHKLSAAVMTKPNRQVCRDCGEELND